MTVWAIGDLQGCYDATQRLLERIAFDPARDRLWFCGDLVNRGGQSLETLRLVHSLRASAVVVLGNHDLSLLAIGERREEEQRKVNPDLQRVVLAPDRDELLGWLRMQKLVHVDRKLGWMMVHAGLAPQWTTQDAERYGREIEQRLRGDQFRRLLKNMYGDGPTWHPKLVGLDRDRAIINICTRMRYCSPRGRISFDDKGGPGTQPVGLYPWYAVPGRATRDLKIVCGHWSTLGLFIGHGVHAIDTGAVWGGRLTALQLDTDELRVVQVPGRDVPAAPPKPRPPAHRPPSDRDAPKAPAHPDGSPDPRAHRLPQPPANPHREPRQDQTHQGQPHQGQPRQGQRRQEPPPSGRGSGQPLPRPAPDPASPGYRAQGQPVQDPPPGGRPVPADVPAKGGS